jgi:hypothetical protein
MEVREKKKKGNNNKEHDKENVSISYIKKYPKNFSTVIENFRIS